MRDVLEEKVYNGVRDIVDKDIDPRCEGITKYSLLFWEEVKEMFDIKYFIRAETVLCEGDTIKLVLTRLTGERVTFCGVSSGYGGEGPRGALKILNECGFEGAGRVLYEEEVVLYK